MMRSAWLFILALFAAPLCSGAEVYPGKPVRIIVAFGTGGTSDLVARVMAQALSDQLGRQFIVENRAGAGGTIAHAFVAKSAPDGYTLLLADTGFSTAPGLFKSLSYDPGKDFTPVTQMVRGPLAMVVPPSLKTNTLKEFIAHARANPGKLNYGSAGTGSPTHLAAELFNRAAKVNIAQIQYKGSGDVMAALLGSQVDMGFAGHTTVIQQVKGGQLRALAVTTDGKRASAMPDVPSMIEAGLPGMAVYLWFGLAGPLGMPREVVNTLHAEVAKALALPSVKERLASLDVELVGSSPEQFAGYIRSEVQRWAEVVKSAGITPE